MSRNRPLRVLHILQHFMTGGIESWLMQVFQRMDPARVRMDVLTHARDASVFDDALEKTGVRLFAFDPRMDQAGVDRAFDRPAFERFFAETLAVNGPYDVAHCHWMFKHSLALQLARRNGAPIRVAHGHMTDPHIPAARRAQLAVRRMRMAGVGRGGVWTHGLACSRTAAATLFGPGWNLDPRFGLLYCGVDMERFHAPLNKAAFRTELDVEPNAFVMAHVGRFDAQKNQLFLLNIAAGAMRREPRARLLLVGEGKDRAAAEARACELGIAHNTRFLGNRPDVGRVLQASDVFVLPSLHEGLPLVGMEAQAAGVPMVVSDVVTTEMDVVPGAITRLSLATPVEQWAGAVLAARPPDPGAALALMEASPFNIENSAAALMDFYERTAERTLRT